MKEDMAMKSLVKTFECGVGIALAAAVASAGALPDGFIELDFVESDGTQCLDTGISPNAQTRVVCDCLFTTTNSSQRCGMVKGSALFMWGRESAYAGRYGSIISTSWNDREDSGVDWERGRHVFDLKSGSQKLDDVEYGTHVMTSTSTQSLWLFGTHYESQAAVNYPCHMRLYACQIYNGTELVRDYVPVRNAEGVIGLYDRCPGGGFVPPKSGRLFAKRQSRLPDGYMLLESVMSVGGQYVDTGVCAGTKTRVVCDCQFTELSSPQRNGSSVSGTVFLWGLESAFDGNFGSIVDKDWNTRENSGQSGDLLRHEFDLRSGSQKLDGAQYGKHTLSATSPRSLRLFGANESDSKVSYPCHMKLFACRVYEDGTLVRDYVPTRDPFGRVGLYDLESGVFSAPTIGALRADVVPPLPQGYTAVEYVESDGTQYLDTGYKVSNQARVICDCQFTRTDVAQRNGLNGGSTVFLWGLESAFSLRFGSIVNKNWDAREDTGIAGDTARHTFDLRPGAQWFDDKRYGTNAYNDNSSATMWLFGGHEGSKMNYACSERIYSCQIYEGNGLKRNYVPVQDASGKAGLYDCVANTFVPASAGTLASGSPLVLGGRPDTLFVTSCPDVNGSVAPAYGFHEGLAAGRGFVCSAPSVVTNVEKGVIATCVGYVVTADGNTVAEGSGASFDYVHPACVAGAVLVWRWRVRHLLPQGTTAIEYVQFPGGVYVDTGVVMADHELRFTYEPTEYVDKASVIGQETGSKYVHWSVWNQKYYWGLSNAESHAETPIWTQSRHSVVMDRAGDHAIVLDGQVLASGTPVTSNGKSLWIGGRDAGKLFKGRIYSLQLVERVTGELALSLVPAMDKNGVVGLFDEVSGRFLLPNASSLSYVPVPFAWIRNSPEEVDGHAALSAEGSIALTVGEPLHVTARRDYVYCKSTKRAYTPDAWGLRVVHADGTVTESSGTAATGGDCLIQVIDGDRCCLTWKWRETERRGMMVIIR